MIIFFRKLMIFIISFFFKKISNMLNKKTIQYLIHSIASVNWVSSTRNCGD